ncbi:MAG: FtsW/RodA/SpoVE family cell cycle protein, partial [Oscillospiraceae bacterium]
VLPIFWHYGMPDHLKRRIAIEFNPEMDKANAGMQQYSGKVALGAGQLDGRGLFNEDLYYVPKAYNDFIFSYIGQALGFIGAITALLIITFLCVRLLVTAKHSNNLLGTYICVGIFAMFFTQTFINIGMVLCVMPVIGVTLPFFSHGGTSIVTCFCAIGLAMSVRRTSKKESMFD